MRSLDPPDPATRYPPHVLQPISRPSCRERGKVNRELQLHSQGPHPRDLVKVESHPMRQHAKRACVSQLLAARGRAINQRPLDLQRISCNTSSGGVGNRRMRLHGCRAGPPPGWSCATFVPHSLKTVASGTCATITRNFPRVSIWVISARRAFRSAETGPRYSSGTVTSNRMTTVRAGYVVAHCLVHRIYRSCLKGSLHSTSFPDPFARAPKMRALAHP